MTKLKEIKKQLKNNNDFKRYKDRFKNKQIQFVLSKISNIFNQDINFESLVEIETKLLNQEIGEEMFIEPMSELEKLMEVDADWKSFASFLWYQYQVSTYRSDIKNNKGNIFEDNIIKMNQLKREFYLKWLHSINKKEENFNVKIIKVAKIIL